MSRSGGIGAAGNFTVQFAQNASFGTASSVTLAWLMVRDLNYVGA